MGPFYECVHPCVCMQTCTHVDQRSTTGLSTSFVYVCIFASLFLSFLSGLELTVSTSWNSQRSICPCLPELRLKAGTAVPVHCFLFWDRVSRWICSLLSQLGQLASEPHGSLIYASPTLEVQVGGAMPSFDVSAKYTALHETARSSYPLCVSVVFKGTLHQFGVLPSSVVNPFCVPEKYPELWGSHP